MNASRQTGMNPQHQRLNNRGVIFRLLATRPSSTRSELAQMSGLTKMTLTNIIAEFIEKGYVSETEAACRGGAWRVYLSDRAPKILSVLIHRTHLDVSLCDFHLNILEYRTARITQYDETTLMNELFRMADELVKLDNVAAIGIGSIGPLDIDRGLILNPPNFYGIRDVPIVKYFSYRYDLPVFLNHHFNCMALAEKIYGAGQPYHDFLFLGFSNELNLSIITGGELYSNNTGFTSEIGHMSINFDGPECTECGLRGCLGNYFGLQDERIPAKELDTMLKRLTTVLASLSNLLNPQAVIIHNASGHLTGDRLTQLENDLNRLIVAHPYRHIDVRCARQLPRLESASCAVTVARQAFSGNLLF